MHRCRGPHGRGGDAGLSVAVGGDHGGGETELNERPRKCPGDLTPRQAIRRSSRHLFSERGSLARFLQARNLLLELAERTVAFRYLVRDRAGQLTAAFDAVLADAGITVLRIPPLSPRANAYAERFVLTVRTELTGRLLIFGERHLRHVLTAYARHYNGQRPHRSRQLRSSRPDDPIPARPALRVTRRTVLRGLLNEYQPAA